MVFSSVTFLFFFLPLVIAVYYAAPRRAHNAVLLAASLVFYTWGTGALVIPLVISIAANYEFGRRIEAALGRDRHRAARLTLAVAVVMNVALLAWFKYANFAVHTFGGVLGAGSSSWRDIVLPIGISFYTFHSLSYLVDIYRRTARHLRNPIDFALYITFFPQLIAGPIVRFHEIRDQLVVRTETSGMFAAGVYRFIHGLGKKILIADSVAGVANAVFSTPTGQLNTSTALLGVTAYTVQLYFDFSGYSDMALGLAQMFGIRLPENFNRPYASRSVTEFWRRWHMSLSRWFRDYLYVPLGGNRGSRLATYRNLIVVFLVTGFWHGANWTFLVWGAYHGVLLLLERIRGIGRDPRQVSTSVVAQARTVGLVMFGWILFRSPDLGYAAGFVRALLRPGLDVPSAVRLATGPLAILCLVIGVGSVLIPVAWVTGLRLERAPTWRVRALRATTLAIVFPVAVVFLLSGTFTPFLYFQF
ncbi:MAG TPA: MBOAT family protein [Candidatus Limnocylindrales bacterium]